MYWINSDSLTNSGDDHNHSSDIVKTRPAKRWGQSCVTAYNKLYIIGGYEGMSINTFKSELIFLNFHRFLSRRCVGVRLLNNVIYRYET